MKNLRMENIERKERITIQVNGRGIIAYRGESVLAALIAAGYTKLRESAVMKENRGALCGMGVCYECQVTINGIPNLRSCMIEVQNGMEIMIP